MDILTSNGRSINDLTGQRFGKLLVQGRDVETITKTNRRPNWHCLCDCGEKLSVPRQGLTRGDTKHCGCINRAKMPYPGKKYGMLTVKSKNEQSGIGLSYSSFVCECDCGTIKSISTKGLLQGCQSCGCLRKIRATEANLKVLTGLRFGRWLVISRDEKGGLSDTAAWWICICDCGVKRSVKSHNLVSGGSKSCGCLHKEIVAETGRSKRTHGETKTRLYNVWAGMKGRCYDKKQPAYKNYGGRGIFVCSEWVNSYETFRDWAIEAGYEAELTIERIDVNDGYSPQNCKFITMKEQARNKRNTVHLTAWGETKKLFEWLEDSRCTVPTYARLRDRLQKGWSAEDAISKTYIAVKTKRKY